MSVECGVEVQIEVATENSDVEPLIIQIPENHLRYFLPDNGETLSRKYLLEQLDNGVFKERPEWDESCFNSRITINIPSININYMLLTDDEDQQQHRQAITHTPVRGCPPLSPINIDELAGQSVLSINPQDQSGQQVRKKGFRWSHRPTLRVISLWKERRQRFMNNTERNEEIWEDIANVMIGEGYNEITSLQCENRFKYLKRMYMETKDINRKSTGQPVKSCAYYDEMDEIFKKSPQVTPPVVNSVPAVLHLRRNSVTSGLKC